MRQTMVTDLGAVMPNIVQQLVEQRSASRNNVRHHGSQIGASASDTLNSEGRGDTWIGCICHQLSCSIDGN